MRRYGFHGLSYTWALARTAELLGRRPEQLQLVMVHLGGGCPACAVREGRSVDTTMGFTPSEGLVMSRRSGSVDPGALTWLLRHRNVSADEIEDALNRRSGLLALSGTSADTRDLVRSRAAGDERAALALDVFTHRCRRGIAGMAASLSRLDALVLTGEIGEDQPEVREEVCARLSLFGLTGGLRPLVAERPEIVSAPGARARRRRSHRRGPADRPGDPGSPGSRLSGAGTTEPCSPVRHPHRCCQGRQPDLPSMIFHTRVATWRLSRSSTFARSLSLISRMRCSR
ncbi:acetate kinase [Streptomyces tauricus]|nr:acetate kinase [Streptomyces tauricus]